MATAPLGDDVYGEDPTVNELERSAAELLQREAACFMPSGTMSNLASLMTHCARGTKVIVGDSSDIYVYEAGGASVCGGIVYHPVPNQPDGTLSIDDLEAVFLADPTDPQFALPALICLENPHNFSGGRVLSTDYLEQVRDLAQRRRVAVHMDGSRLFNASTASGVKPAVIASYADSVQFCLSKGLSAPVGSLVVGDGPFIDGVRRRRKMLGGGMRQAGVLAAAGFVALTEMTSRLEEDHVTAARLADGLARTSQLELVGPVETNIVIFRLRGGHQRTSEVVDRVGDFGVRVAELGAGRIRCVTHPGVSTDDIDYAVEVFRHVLASPEHRREE